ncbi:hypothetical protein T492DRAFT_836650 [Pavlovales sp. CCMP2436]|nr:hypothetical protein T492DRAFT_836650 [Pavlovales sp. CCMP2436]
MSASTRGAARPSSAVGPHLRQAGVTRARAPEAAARASMAPTMASSRACPSERLAAETDPLSSPITRAGQHHAPIRAGMLKSSVANERASDRRSPGSSDATAPGAPPPSSSAATPESTSAAVIGGSSSDTRSESSPSVRRASARGCRGGICHAPSAQSSSVSVIRRAFRFEQPDAASSSGNAMCCVREPTAGAAFTLAMGAERESRERLQTKWQIRPS